MISGTIGSKQTTAEINKRQFKLSTKKKTLMNSLSIICFQRTGLGLKTIDVVWLTPEIIHVHTISSQDYETIRTHASEIPTYDLGPQVGSWKKWHKKAIQEQWSEESWKEFLQTQEPIVVESEPDSEDSDWQPESEEESEEESDLDMD